MPIDFITSEEDGFEKNWIFPYMNIPTNSIESELEERYYGITYSRTHINHTCWRTFAFLKSHVWNQLWIILIQIFWFISYQFRLGNKRATKSTSNAFYTSNQHKPDRPSALLAETDRYLSDNSVNRIIDLSLPRKK